MAAALAATAFLTAAGAASQQTSEAPAAARNYWAFKLPVQEPVPVIDRKDFTNATKPLHAGWR